MSKDQKEALTSARKADITHVRTPAMVYAARACEYGNVKYDRANYLRPATARPGQSQLAAAFERLRAYLRADISHKMQVLDAMELHQATDPELKDDEGMKRAAYCADTDATPGAKVGASGLPHLCGGLASGNMAVTQAVQAGLLPADPGRPWETQTAGLPRFVRRRHLKPGERGCYVLVSGVRYTGGMPLPSGYTLDAHGADGDVDLSPNDQWVQVDA